MLFNSYIFVLLFLPLTIGGYYGCNYFKKYGLARGYLLAMSLFFYGYFNIRYLPIILASILFNYGINRGLHLWKGRRIRFLTLLVAVGANVGVLFYFKYYDFFLQNLNLLFQRDFILRNLVLPLGISFFTFQQLSYAIDSYHNQVPNYHFLDYALFVTFFPQLIAGPIVTHDEIVPQFADPAKKKLNFDYFSKGLFAFSLGLGKKVLIADTFGRAVAWGYGNAAALDTTNAFFVMLAYTIQIYFDFSGYCDMATGLGCMFNIDIPMNFNSPYKSLTITEFWKRWHITLTRFFTRYIYIPMGGSRKGKIKTYFNVLLIFFISGLWHGANWTFLLWGIIHGLFSVITRIFSKAFEKFHPAFNWLLTFGFINVAWIYFRASSVGQANGIVKAILSLQFGAINQELLTSFVLPELRLVLELFQWNRLLEYTPFFFVVFFAFAFVAILQMKNTNQRLEVFRPTITNGIITVGLLLWSVVSFSGVSTFLYFNF